MREQIDAAVRNSEADYTEIGLEEGEDTRVSFRGPDLETADVAIDRGGKEFIYDLKTEAPAETSPTGNGERGLFSPPSPAFSDLVVANEQTPVDAIISDIDEGLLVETALGLGQGNVLSGAFSNNLSLAFKIKNGEVTGRVKDVSVAGNIYQDLQDIEAVSRESEWVYGGIRLPYILLPDLNIVTRG